MAGAVLAKPTSLGTAGDATMMRVAETEPSVTSPPGAVLRAQVDGDGERRPCRAVRAVEHRGPEARAGEGHLPVAERR